MVEPAGPFEGGRPIAMAHRGGYTAGEPFAENTVAAFATATELGYRYLETDVRTTSDGVLVAFHDALLQRVTDGAGVVAHTSWPALQRLRVEGEPIATMAELLERFEGAVFTIDLKTDSGVEPLLSTILHHGAADRVSVSSFSVPRLHRFRRLAAGRVATSASPVEVVATRIGSPVGRGPGVALQVPLRRRVAGRQVAVLTPDLLRRAHQRGQQVHVWTVNVASEMHRLLDLGVDGIITDTIDLLRAVLVERGEWA